MLCKYALVSAQIVKLELCEFDGSFLVPNTDTLLLVYIVKNKYNLGNGVWATFVSKFSK